ncbi:monocyte to macrophage differentiation factor 2 isoform X2 [Pezoporus flaviventris]|uniref:monocyte to macrophage differentiation factor 2 isoform X2 n=1 Tax=Pezoporus flaviventris TaxID=889875 RepID=UPI002AB07CC3|nr:monocyte to macrophage differentiation factor 2 isoform X2 [Pezoporus flaviventris]
MASFMGWQPTLCMGNSSHCRFMNHRVPSNCRYQPTEYEHAANCATHAFWILPSILGSSILYILSDDQWETISAWIYGCGLSSLFIVSTIFHTISWKKRHLRTVEHCLHMFDRMVIYFFIAASYAPWLNLRELGPWASHMRWIIWIMASVGTVYVFFFHERYKLVELVCYVIMGFFPALVILSMPNRDGLPELVAGGFSYCLGMVFFKSDGRIPFAHAIWHLFVAIGAGIHYYAIWRAPQSPQALQNPFSQPVLGAQLSTSPPNGPGEPTRMFCPWGALFSSPISVPWHIQSTAPLPGSCLCLQAGSRGGIRIPASAWLGSAHPHQGIFVLLEGGKQTSLDWDHGAACLFCSHSGGEPIAHHH